VSLLLDRSPTPHKRTAKMRTMQQTPMTEPTTIPAMAPLLRPLLPPLSLLGAGETIEPEEATMGTHDGRVVDADPLLMKLTRLADNVVADRSFAGCTYNLTVVTPLSASPLPNAPFESLTPPQRRVEDGTLSMPVNALMIMGINVLGVTTVDNAASEEAISNDTTAELDGAWTALHPVG